MGKALFPGFNGSRDPVVAGGLLFDGFAEFEDEPVDIDLVGERED